jgi:hypothetical protein
MRVVLPLLRGSGFTQILVIPGKPPLISVANKTGPREAMELSWAHNHLRGHVDTLKRLIHLLAANQRHVEVFVAAHEQRWCLDPLRCMQPLWSEESTRQPQEDVAQGGDRALGDPRLFHQRWYRGTCAAL